MEVPRSIPGSALVLGTSTSRDSSLRALVRRLADPCPEMSPIFLGRRLKRRPNTKSFTASLHGLVRVASADGTRATRIWEPRPQLPGAIQDTQHQRGMLPATAMVLIRATQARS